MFYVNKDLREGSSDPAKQLTALFAPPDRPREVF